MNDGPSSPIHSLRAKEDFNQAFRRGFWRTAWGWLTNQSNDLLPFDEVRKALPPSMTHDLGLREIELDHIVGSVGRYNDFDSAFLPRRLGMRQRWESVDRAILQDISLPPIEVYKIGALYFVKDGNHRVSVARQRGQVFIDAYVTEINVAKELQAETDIDELIRKTEQHYFNEQTQLLSLRPDARIEFSVPGGPTKLMEHIRTHRWFMGESRKAEVPYPEAVASWYDTVYLPLVRVIREKDMLKDFPNRTESDLYLWIIEHLWYMKEEYHGEVSPEEAAEHFAENFAPQPFQWLLNLLNHAGDISPE